MSKISRRRRDYDPQGRQTCWASPRRRCPSCLRVQRYGNFSVPPNLSPTFFTFSCIFLHFAVKGRLFRPKKGRRKGKAAGAGKGHGGGGTGGEGRGLRHSPTLLYIRARDATGRRRRAGQIRPGRAAGLSHSSELFFFGGGLALITRSTRITRITQSIQITQSIRSTRMALSNP